MELPYNTTISSDILKHTGQFAELSRTWATKRRWVQEAFSALERAGYHIGSAYTAVKNPARTKFVYRDRLWQGADLVGLGVASFGHVNGVHMQNLDTWEKYSAAIERDEIPLGRAYRPTTEERLIREFVLQLKRGALAPDYFADQVRRGRARAIRRGARSLTSAGYLARADRESDRAHARRDCCASTCCCRASSSRSTPAFAIRNAFWVLRGSARFYRVLLGSFEVPSRDEPRPNLAEPRTNPQNLAEPAEPCRTCRTCRTL